MNNWTCLSQIFLLQINGFLQVQVLKLGRDYWFLRSAYNWNHFCSLVRPPVYSDWMENWKLEKVMTRDSRRTRCTKYFQICWDATELQRAASSTLQKKNNQSARKTVNLAKVQFAEKVKVKNDSLSGEMCPWSFKSIQRSATKSSHFLSAFCPFLQFGPNRIFWYRVTLS